jgi:hypothetical protein
MLLPGVSLMKMVAGIGTQRAGPRKINVDLIPKELETLLGINLNAPLRFL